MTRGIRNSTVEEIRIAAIMKLVADEDKRRGYGHEPPRTQSEPMTRENRVRAYGKQSGAGEFTPAQRRRLASKSRRHGQTASTAQNCGGL